MACPRRNGWQVALYSRIKAINSRGDFDGKAGVAVLTKYWATALASKGVRVNAVCPGLVEEGAATEAERKHMAGQIPLGRPVRPQEIAATVRWLVTESPESMTGSLIAVSGAWEY